MSKVDECVDGIHVDQPVSMPDSTVSMLSVFTVQKVISLAEGNILYYIAGYIARKIKNHKYLCNVCAKQITGEINQTSDMSQTQFLLNKQYDTLSADKGLIVPSDTLVDLCSSFESKFREVISSAVYMSGCRQHIMRCFCKACNHHCETCQFVGYVANIFVNIRLHHFLRDSNRQFVSIKHKRNRKTVKFEHL